MTEFARARAGTTNFAAVTVRNPLFQALEQTTFIQATSELLLEIVEAEVTVVVKNHETISTSDACTVRSFDARHDEASYSILQALKY